MQICIKTLYSDAVLPAPAEPLSAGNDLHAHIPDDVPNREVHITPGETVFINTGIACAIPEGYFGALYARSGLACKEGLRPANCVGVIDASYRGEIKVALHNDGSVTRHVKHGDRIAQLVIQKFEPVEWNQVEELDKTDRSLGGFGSTGR